mgnify:CR=1 FL=1
MKTKKAVTAFMRRQNYRLVSNGRRVMEFEKRDTSYRIAHWQSTTDCQDAIRWCDSPIEVFHEDHAWKTSTA